MATPAALTGVAERRRPSMAASTVCAASNSRTFGRTAALNPGVVPRELRRARRNPFATRLRLRRPVSFRARSASSVLVCGSTPAASSRSSSTLRQAAITRTRRFPGCTWANGVASQAHASRRLARRASPRASCGWPVTDTCTEHPQLACVKLASRPPLGVCRFHQDPARELDRRQARSNLVAGVPGSLVGEFVDPSKEASFAAELLLQREHVTHVLFCRRRLPFLEHRRQSLVVARGRKRGVTTGFAQQ